MKTKTLALIALALGSLTAPAPLPAQTRSAPPAAAAAAARELDAFIRQGMRDWEIPGLSVAVVHRDSVVFLRGYGVRRLGASDSVDARTLFGMMSTTKAFTALAIAMLVDDGRLRWEDPVGRWVPEFELPEPYATRELTVRDLLTHNAGLGNADLLWARGDLDAAEIFRRVRLLTPAYSFRGGFAYQNIMYGLAGEVVARASGMPWAEFVRTRIYEPLGMRRSFPTYRAMSAGVSDSNVSAPHDRVRDTIRAIDEQTVDVIPAAGAAWSTAEDVTRWLRFLLDSGRVEGRRLVSEAGFRRLITPQVIIPNIGQFYPSARLTRPHWMTYGLGWFQQDYQGRFVSFHTGSLAGRVAIIGLIPDERLGVYVFGNLDHAEFRHALMLKVFDLFTGAPRRDWSAELKRIYDEERLRGDSTRRARLAQQVAGTQPSLPLERYAGRYLHPLWGDVVVGLEDGALTVRVGPNRPGRLSHFNYDTFVVEWSDGRSEGSVRFVLDERGNPSELRLSGSGQAAFVRQAQP